MLLIALALACAVLFPLAWHANTDVVQITIATLAVVCLLGFIAGAIWMVKKLGPLALAEGRDLITLRQLEAREIVAKNHLELPIQIHPIPDPEPKKLLEAEEPEEGED